MLFTATHTAKCLKLNSRWHSDERFFAPMIIHKNGDHIFVGDTVNFQDPAHGPCYGKVVKFMTEVIVCHFYSAVHKIYHLDTNSLCM